MLDSFLVLVILVSVIGLTVLVIGLNHLADWTIGYEEYLKECSEVKDH